MCTPQIEVAKLFKSVTLEMMDEAQPFNGEWFSLPVHTIAQAQKEGHEGGYVAMTLTFKMATTGKWTNLIKKVAKVKLFECNH